MLRRNSFQRPRARLLIVPLVVLALGVTACALDDPSDPTQPASLTGQNPNVNATFDGTIKLSGSAQGTADGQTDTFVSARVNDLSGNPAANGTPVSFVTTFGTVRMLGTDPAGAGSAVQAIVFNGVVTVALRSSAVGVATVTAWIANVSSTVQVDFLPQSSNLFADLIFLTSAAGTVALEGTAPLSATLETTVTNSEGAAVSGATVRFRIIDDSTGGGGARPAEIAGSGTDLTNTSGKATGLLRIDGVGTVIVLSEVLSKNKVVATSNQVIATTTTVGETVGLSLVLGSGGTVANVTAGTSSALRVTVRDQRTGLPLTGRRVNFHVVSDTAQSSKATLANPGVTITDSQGVATNAITATEINSTVVVLAQLLGIDGQVEALSNQVVLTVSQTVGMTLTIAGGTAVGNVIPGSSTGIEVLVRDTSTGAPLTGKSIAFVIVSDTAVVDKAKLASTQLTLTNGVGVASNAVTVEESGSQVVIIARLIGAGGKIEAESNQIVLTVQ